MQHFHHVAHKRLTSTTISSTLALHHATRLGTEMKHPYTQEPDRWTGLVLTFSQIQ